MINKEKIRIINSDVLNFRHLMYETYIQYWKCKNNNTINSVDQIIEFYQIKYIYV